MEIHQAVIDGRQRRTVRCVVVRSRQPADNSCHDGDASERGVASWTEARTHGLSLSQPITPMKLTLPGLSGPGYPWTFQGESHG